VLDQMMTASETVGFYQVSDFVNNSRNDSEECLQAVKNS